MSANNNKKLLFDLLVFTYENVGDNKKVSFKANEQNKL